MPRQPRVTSAQIMGVIEKVGFEKTRSSGSHIIFKNSAGRRVTLPSHAGKIIHPKTLSSILRDAELSIEQLLELL